MLEDERHETSNTNRLTSQQIMNRNKHNQQTSSTFLPKSTQVKTTQTTSTKIQYAAVDINNKKQLSKKQNRQAPISNLPTSTTSNYTNKKKHQQTTTRGLTTVTANQ